MLNEPLEALGERVTEVGTVTWLGGTIEPGEFAEFSFSGRPPDEPGTLEFPAVQTYDSGGWPAGSARPIPRCQRHWWMSSTSARRMAKGSWRY